MRTYNRCFHPFHSPHVGGNGDWLRSGTLLAVSVPVPIFDRPQLQPDRLGLVHLKARRRPGPFVSASTRQIAPVHLHEVGFLARVCQCGVRLR